jgi:hypothetical protein
LGQINGFGVDDGFDAARLHPANDVANRLSARIKPLFSKSSRCCCLLEGTVTHECTYRVIE